LYYAVILVKLGDDHKLRGSTRNIARRSFLTMTSDSLNQVTSKAARTVSPRSRAGKMTLRFWKCGSANEEVQRLAIEASKFPKFDNIHPAFAALTFGDE
jgi:hypothetical protein